MKPSTAYLLDVNVLMALAWPVHPAHRRVVAWLESVGDTPCATCTVTELGFIRLSGNRSVLAAPVSATDARDTLAALHVALALRRWAEPVTGALSEDVAAKLRRVAGHGQVMDAYLVALAASKGGRVATLDDAMARTWGLDVELIPR